ncbi:MAG: hypothetical protein ACK6CU_01370 [Deltaproteobacteria bacterium]|jgi:hypothetical protein
MDTDALSLVFSGVRLVGGLFDFLVFAGLLGVALVAIRKVDATLAYVLTAAAGVRYLTICCSNVSLSAPLGDAGAFVEAAFSVVTLFLELGLWAAVLYALHALARRAPTQG